MEASGGIVLVAAAAAALLLANSALSGSYDALVHAELRIVPLLPTFALSDTPAKFRRSWA